MPYKDPASKKAHDKAYHLLHRDARIASGKRYYEKHKDRCLAKMRERSKMLYQTDVVFREKRRCYDLKRMYGISVAEYDRMFQLQGGVCAICRGGSARKYGRLEIDHEHPVGMVRGLLCNRCNKVLGLVNDNSDLLIASAEYLRRSRLRVVAS